MKVLMLGWEFAPHITGGLGTACRGLAEELVSHVDHLTFLLPKKPSSNGAEEVFSNLSVTDVKTFSNVDIDSFLAESSELKSKGSSKKQAQEPKVSYKSMPSLLEPYALPGDFKEQEAKHWEWIRNLKRLTMMLPNEVAQLLSGQSDLFNLDELHGGYGRNLLDEVSRYASAIGQMDKVNEYDLVHAHDWMTFPAAVTLKARWGIKFIAHVHSLEFDRSGDAIHNQVYEIEKMGLTHADIIFAVSQRTKNMIIQKYNISPDKIKVIYNGVAPLDSHSIKKQDVSKPLVVFMGRVTMQKGPEYFLEAAYLVSKVLPETNFVMAGMGDMRDRMVFKMAQLGLLDKFHFTGFINEQDRSKLLSQSSVFVLSSVSEPFGLAPVEAAQYGVPIVLSKQSGVAEVIKHALKVDFWDAKKMADAIIKILSEPGFAQHLAREVKKEVASMTWKQPALSVYETYKEVTNERNQFLFSGPPAL